MQINGKNWVVQTIINRITRFLEFRHYRKKCEQVHDGGKKYMRNGIKFHIV